MQPHNAPMRDFHVTKPPHMNSMIPLRRTLISVAALLLAPYPVAVVQAAPITWTGFGASAFWSDALNWSPQAAGGSGILAV
jgi:hypothetical protein